MPALIGWLFRALISAGVGKFFSSISLVFSITAAITLLSTAGFLPSWFSPTGLSNAFSSFLSSSNAIGGKYSAYLLYALDYFMISHLIVLALSAEIARFVIRRSME